MSSSSDPTLARYAALAVLRRLREHGHVAYLAGGCVRDALLGLRPTDYDIATDATPDRVTRLFKRAQLVGASFGVVMVTVYERDLDLADRADVAPAGASSTPSQSPRRASIEVATFRSDGPYHDARRPAHVTFADAPADARRRDFTINALFLDPLAPPDPASPVGQVIDYVQGVSDLKARVLRAVGDPEQRLAEDHLRALRAVRFAARYTLAIDPATAAAITRHASELKGVSRERIGEEVRRMLSAPTADRALTILHELALDAPVLSAPSLPPSILQLTPQLVAAARAAAKNPRTLAVLASWLTDRHRAAAPSSLWLADADLKSAVANARASMCLSNEESAELSAILTTADRSSTWPSLAVAARKRLAASSGFDGALALLRASDPTAAAGLDADVRELSQDGIGIHPDPLIAGDQLIAQGWQPGPQFKRVLDQVYDAQLEGRVRSVEAGLELAEALRV